jgi:site-specific recombinase XerD
VRESAFTKGRRLLVEGRVRILAADEDGGSDCRGARRLRPDVRRQPRRRRMGVLMPVGRAVLTRRCGAARRRNGAAGDVVTRRPRLGWGGHECPREAGTSGGGHPNNGGSECSPTLTAENLAFASQVRAEAMKDKHYRVSPIGEEVGRYMRAQRWGGASDNTLRSYEHTLARLALDYAHKQLADITVDDVREFLDEHWGASEPATRAQRLAAVRSFFNWAVEEGRLQASPIQSIKAPKVVNRERNAYKPDLIHKLVVSQPALRDQIALQLLGQLGLRRNELRLLRLLDFDLSRGAVLIHGKGGKQVVLPLGIEQLKKDLELHLVGRDPGEYLLHPKNRTTEPMTNPSVHNWFKRCLERAGLPRSIQMHELRHSAADTLFRSTGNVLLAQQLLRHQNLATTQRYLHPSRDDLEQALARLEVLRSDEGEAE